MCCRILLLCCVYLKKFCLSKKLPDKSTFFLLSGIWASWHFWKGPVFSSSHKKALKITEGKAVSDNIEDCIFHHFWAIYGSNFNKKDLLKSCLPCTFWLWRQRRTETLFCFLFAAKQGLFHRVDGEQEENNQLFNQDSPQLFIVGEETSALCL